MESDSNKFIRIRIQNWNYWEGQAKDLPELKSIDPLLRRRLSPQGRAALWVADQCMNGIGSVRVVYASQHGELARTLGLIESLRPEHHDGPSPASFALSVLNSTPGIYSIARKDKSPAIAISSGEESCWCGLLEAGLTQIDSNGPVLLIAADAPIPSLFLKGETDGTPLRALAVLIGAEGREFELSYDDRGGASILDPIAALSEAIASGGEWSMKGRTWRLGLRD